MMKNILISAIAIAFAGTVLAPAVAEDRPDLKAPPKTMGDEPGKLPATGTMEGRVPEMGATPNTAQPGDPGGPKGPPKTMGDEPGKLPATGTMGRNVPGMTSPDSTRK